VKVVLDGLSERGEARGVAEVRHEESDDRPDDRERRRVPHPHSGARAAGDDLRGGERPVELDYGAATRAEEAPVALEHAPRRTAQRPEDLRG
jgi:hypothetical protein